jgi:hypothetical protein
MDEMDDVEVKGVRWDIRDLALVEVEVEVEGFTATQPGDSCSILDNAFENLKKTNM